jgi:deoxyribodipyrimidine photo-lyase
MQRAIRIQDNPALDIAIEAGNVLGLPVVVYFQVIPNYPNANLRHYHFLQQGLRDVEQDAAERGVGFVVRRPGAVVRRAGAGGNGATLEGFLEEVQAALVVGDENPCREPERWRRVLAKRLRVPFWTVDADVVVPSRVFDRTFVLLHHFRPHLKRELPKFLVEQKNPSPLNQWQPGKGLEAWDLKREITEGFAKLDRTVEPVDSFTGGTHAALRRLSDFVHLELRDYVEKRNHPELRGTSRLSPYLHFGNIGPITIALAVRKAASAHCSSAWVDGQDDAGAEAQTSSEVASARLKSCPDTKPTDIVSAAEKYLDELIGWRELAVLFVRHEPNYDNWECAAPWARKSLMEHADDPRPHRYTLEQLERGETKDELWNAAQLEMVNTGWMHNYMRMYWGKKILEWAPNPATAFDWAVILNDRYGLDGRDPNGYAGIAWAIVGRHDRPWFDRPIFGLVRTMMEGSTRKKFDAESYIRQNRGSEEL